MTGVLAIRVTDFRGHHLMLLRKDYGAWALPGGKIDEGEPWAKAAARELFEEVGLIAQTFTQIGWIDYFHNGEQYIVLFVQAVSPLGTAENREPEKHADMAYLDMSQPAPGGAPYFKNLTDFMDARRHM